MEITCSGKPENMLTEIQMCGVLRVITNYEPVKGKVCMSASSSCTRGRGYMVITGRKP